MSLKPSLQREDAVRGQIAITFIDLDNCCLEIFNVEVAMEARWEWAVNYMVSNIDL